MWCMKWLAFVCLYFLYFHSLFWLDKLDLFLWNSSVNHLDKIESWLEMKMWPDLLKIDCLQYKSISGNIGLNWTQVPQETYSELFLKFVFEFLQSLYEHLLNILLPTQELFLINWIIKTGNIFKKSLKIIKYFSKEKKQNVNTICNFFQKRFLNNNNVYLDNNIHI